MNYNIMKLSGRETEIVGKAYIFGNDIDTDQIYPGRYLYLTLPDEMARHAIEDVDSQFYEKIKDEGE